MLRGEYSHRIFCFNSDKLNELVVFNLEGNSHNPTIIPPVL